MTENNKSQLQQSLISEIPPDEDGGAEWKILEDGSVIYFDGIKDWNESVDEIIELLEEGVYVPDQVLQMLKLTDEKFDETTDYYWDDVFYEQPGLYDHRPGGKCDPPDSGFLGEEINRMFEEEQKDSQKTKPSTPHMVDVDAPLEKKTKRKRTRTGGKKLSFEDSAFGQYLAPHDDDWSRKRKLESGTDNPLDDRWGSQKHQRWSLTQLFGPHVEDCSKWTLDGLKHWHFVPYRKGMFKMGNDFLNTDGDYNLPVSVPSEMVLRVHEVPCTIDFWLVLDKPEPKEPYGTIAFDVPEDILDVEQLDSNNRLAEGMTVKDLMSQILNRVRWIAIAPDELPEMMLGYYQ